MKATVEARAVDRPEPQEFSGDDDRWQAVAGRDRRADGQFYYSVATTGVYCRPSCGARLARRENVGFHQSIEAAEKAGFRACKRCRPDETDRQATAVAQACRIIEQADTPPNLTELADAVGLSPFHFHRVFKAATGVTPKAYADAERARRMRVALDEADTVTEAIYDAGFNSNGRFYASAPQRLGMTPTRFRKGGAGETVRFAIGETSLGAILVAATDKGIAAIQFADDPDQLLRGLQDRFPNAVLIGDDPAFDRLVAQVVGKVENPSAGLDLPLDIRGTAFQQRVWQALMEIPAGSTASYSEIAERLGAPKAVRAVAGACAANAIAVAIPCHRVVRNDGALSGYRWGVERKRALLEREAGGVIAASVAADLDAEGFAVVSGLVDPEQCRSLAALYSQGALFRKRIDMGRHGYGRGAYGYFAYPLSDLVAGLRTALYPPLAEVANRWNEVMGFTPRYPAAHGDFLEVCHGAGQVKPTPLILRYGPGDYNRLHQDLYGEHVFPLQVAILLSRPGEDFTGGEFVLTEQRPRMQSRAEVVPLGQGDAVIFAVCHHPVYGSHGASRAVMRHGVSRLRSGERLTLRIIFHDAA